MYEPGSRSAKLNAPGGSLAEVTVRAVRPSSMRTVAPPMGTPPATTVPATEPVDAANVRSSSVSADATTKVTERVWARCPGALTVTV